MHDLCCSLPWHLTGLAAQSRPASQRRFRLVTARSSCGVASLSFVRPHLARSFDCAIPLIAAATPSHNYTYPILFPLSPYQPSSTPPSAAPTASLPPFRPPSRVSVGFTPAARPGSQPDEPPPLYTYHRTSVPPPATPRQLDPTAPGQPSPTTTGPLSAHPDLPSPESSGARRQGRCSTSLRRRCWACIAAPQKRLGARSTSPGCLRLCL